MPIKPENKLRYPKDWKAIRARILNRDGNRCKWCGVENYAIGTRDRAGKFHPMGMMEADVASLDGEKVIKIVLTVAHIDHQPENCADENLAALCQQCHLRHDIDHHRKNSAATLAAKKAAGTLELFEAKS